MISVLQFMHGILGQAPGQSPRLRERLRRIHNLDGERHHGWIHSPQAVETLFATKAPSLNKW